MSWSVNFSGPSDEVVKSLEAHAETIPFPDSKAEYESALPGLLTLVKLNTGSVTLIANGHAFGGGAARESNCRVSLT